MAIKRYCDECGEQFGAVNGFPSGCRIVVSIDGRSNPQSFAKVEVTAVGKDLCSRCVIDVLSHKWSPRVEKGHPANGMG